MANNGKPVVSFDEIIQQGRQKRRAEALAQEIFGKRRASAPANPPKSLGGSLASRVGVNKRNSSIPRSESPRLNAQRPSQKQTPGESHRSRPSRLQRAVTTAEPVKAQPVAEELNGGDGLYIRGAARGPYTVVASNFAIGTTAADIESVMEAVGGDILRCNLTSTSPMVVAEIDFQDKSGADKVVDTFNGKKADGRVLHVFTKSFSGAPATAPLDPAPAQPRQVAPPVMQDVPMDVDENAEARETEDRLRENRRAVDENPSFPTGPRNPRSGYDNYYDRRPRQHMQPGGGYGFGGGDRYGGNRGRYYDDPRRYGGGGGGGGYGYRQ